MFSFLLRNVFKVEFRLEVRLSGLKSLRGNVLGLQQVRSAFKIHKLIISKMRRYRTGCMPDYQPSVDKE